MSKLLSLVRQFFAFEAGNVRFHAWEWAIMRILLAISLFGSFRLAGYNALDWAGSPGRSGWQVAYPRGFAQFFDINWIVAPQVVPWLAGAVCLGLVLLVLGVCPLFASSLLLVIKTLIGTLENSSSSNVYHTSQISCFVLLGIVLGCIYNHIAAFQRNRWTAHAFYRYRRSAEPSEQEFATVSRSRIIYTVQQMIAAAYVVAGISKLWRSNGGWINDTANIHLQFVKNQTQTYYETLAPVANSNWAVDFVMNYPAYAKVALGIGLFMELFAFLALWNRRMSLLMGLGLVAMHTMIASIMFLNFDLNIHMVVIFLVNLPFWLVPQKTQPQATR